MNYKKNLIRSLVIFLITALVFLTGTFVVNAAVQYVKIYDKDGNTVKHYGTLKEVELPREYFTAEYEMRGVWVATVYNIAIGKQNGVNDKAINAFKNEFLQILDRMEEYNMNTLYFQVRPSNDAFYKSELNPWSQFLAGAGVDPGWDPLEWMVNETHKRGFVFQCWMNAFRVTVYTVLPSNEDQASQYTNEQLIKFKQDAIAKLADGNFAKLNPDCVVMGESDTRLILNPSDPRVQQFLVDTAMEIVENYDIDGFHFDDYFYLSGGGGANTHNGNFAGGKTYDEKLVGDNCLNDLPNYEAYKAGKPEYEHLEKGLNLGDFRRASLNHMIKSIRLAVDKYNEENNDVVEFGAKPAAVWRSNTEYCTENEYRCVPNGSNTHASAYSSYNDLYADTLTWVKEGWVDYMAPQVYYGFTSTEAPYADIVMWWAEQIKQINEQNKAEGKKQIKLYIAHGIYKYRDDKKQFALASEVKNQLYYNQKFDSIVGSAFYSYENLYKFVDKTHENGMNLVKKTWSEKVIPVPVGSYDATGLEIKDLKIRHPENTSSYSLTFTLLENANVYVVYKTPKGTPLDISDVTSRMIVEFEGYQEGKQLSINIDDYDENYDYYIKAFSKRYHPSDVEIKLDFENAESYIPLVVDEKINLEKNTFAPSSNIQIKVNAKYEETKELRYTIYVESDGDERQVSTGVVEGDFIEYTWKAWPFASMENKIRVVFTDGEIIKEVTSDNFIIGVEYAITYNLGNAPATVDGPTTYLEGLGVEELPTPSVTNTQDTEYKFLYWTVNGKQVSNIDMYSTGNVELVAVWEVNLLEQPKKGCGKSSAQVMVTTLSALSLVSILSLKKKD